MIQTVDKFFAGNCDANGSFTSSTIQPAPALYGALRVVAQTTGGAARWTINVGGTAKAFSPGAKVDIPILTQPNQSVIVQITGAAPNASVSGVLTGIGGHTLDEVAPFVSLVPNTITLDTLVSQQQIDSFTQAPNVVVSGRLYLLPAGTQNVRIQVNENALAVTFTNYIVIGQGTGIIYVPASAAGGGTGGFDNWFKPAPPDVAAGISFSLNTTGSANGVEVVITADLAMNFVEVNMIGNGTASGAPILVQSVNGNPAVWQAGTFRAVINSAPVPSAGHVTVVNASGGQKVYPKRYSFFEDGANSAGGGRWTFQDTSGTAFHDCLTSGNRGPIDNGDFEGIPVPIGLGIQITNGGANASFISGYLDYQQF